MEDYSLAKMYGYQSKNPHEKKAEILAQLTGQMSNDKYGYGAIAKIPMMALIGAELNKGEEWDEARGAGLKGYLDAKMKLEADKTKKEHLMKIFERINSAVLTGNEGWVVDTVNYFKDDLGLSADKIVEAAKIDKDSKSTTFKIVDKKDGGTAFINYGPEGIKNFNFDEQTWQPLNKEGMDMLGKKPDVQTSILSPGQQLVNAETGQKIADLPKPFESKLRTYEVGGEKITQELQPNETWKTIGTTEKDDIEGKGFGKYISQLNSLYGRASSIQKGYDPILGTTIPQENIEKALSEIRPQIERLEGYVSVTYPKDWARYNIKGGNRAAQFLNKKEDDTLILQFLSDPKMKGKKVGKLTDKGYEVLENGKVIGYYGW